VAVERQDELLDVLVGASEQVMQHLPGFISGNFHASKDGTEIINYVQWEDEATLKAAQTDPAAQKHMTQAVEIADRIEPMMYTVETVHHRR